MSTGTKIWFWGYIRFGGSWCKRTRFSLIYKLFPEIQIRKRIIRFLYKPFYRQGKIQRRDLVKALILVHQQLFATSILPVVCHMCEPKGSVRNTIATMRDIIPSVCTVYTPSTSFYQIVNNNLSWNWVPFEVNNELWFDWHRTILNESIIDVLIVLIYIY